MSSSRHLDQTLYLNPKFPNTAQIRLLLEESQTNFYSPKQMVYQLTPLSEPPKLSNTNLIFFQGQFKEYNSFVPLMRPKQINKHPLYAQSCSNRRTQSNEMIFNDKSHYPKLIGSKISRRNRSVKNQLQTSFNIDRITEITSYRLNQSEDLLLYCQKQNKRSRRKSPNLPINCDSVVKEIKLKCDKWQKNEKELMFDWYKRQQLTQRYMKLRKSSQKSNQFELIIK